MCTGSYLEASPPNGPSSDLIPSDPQAPAEAEWFRAKSPAPKLKIRLLSLIT
jgi:hypothetical protein